MSLEHVVQRHGCRLMVCTPQRSSLSHLLERGWFLCLSVVSGDSRTSNRRPLKDSSTVYYQQQTSGPTETVESYRFYSQPSTNTTQVTEERRYYQVPSQQQQQQSEISYSIEGTQQKFQPVSFLVTTDQPNNSTTSMTIDEERSMTINPYQMFGAQLRGRPSAAAPRQPGPAYSPYQSTDAHELESMQTESDISSIHLIRSADQQSSSSYSLSRPTFSKVSHQPPSTNNKSRFSDPFF